MTTMAKRSTQRSCEMFERIKHSIAGGESSYARLRAGIELCIDHTAGPFFQIFFGDTEQDRLYNYRDTMAYVREDIYSAWHEEMQTRGVYFHPGQFERWFLSTEHTERDIDLTIAAAEESIGAVAGRIPPTMGTRPHPGHQLADAA